MVKNCKIMANQAMEGIEETSDHKREECDHRYWESLKETHI